MSEALIQQQILEAFGARPKLRIWRANTGAAMVKGRLVRFGVPGQPDIQGIIAPTGKYLGIEVKSPTGRQSEEQKLFQAMVERQGGIYILARSVDDVRKILEPLLA